MDNKKESPYKLNNINIDENSIRIKNIIMLFTIYLGTSVVVGLILPLLNLTITEDTVYNLLGTLNVIVTLIALILILFYSKKNNLKLFNRESKGTKNPVRYILLVLYTMCAMTLPSVILNYANNVNANGNATSANQELLTKISDNINIYFLFFMIVILAPITEEILFRGIPLFFKAKNKKYNSTIFILLRLAIFSLIFGSLHNPKNLVELLAYSSSGFFMGLSVVLTNRLETSLVIHILNNLIGFLALVGLL